MSLPLSTNCPAGLDAQAPLPADIVLSLEGLTKKFCRSLKRSLFYGLQDIGSEVIGRQRQTDCLRQGEFWVLKDINFQLQQGQAMGLIGNNGSGKTTLLKVISGLLKPDRGRVRVRGRVAPLIALGAAFDLVLTGRENLYINMSILGVPQREIDRCFDDVVEFAEIADALDTPLQNYSSGMIARLGFASAAYAHPDILLIDEVLAVGDIRFRMKCYRRLAELRQEGVAFILVAHAPQLILSLCDTALYLKKGEQVIHSDPATAMEAYENDLFPSEAGYSELTLSPKPQEQSTGLDIRSLYFLDYEGRKLEYLLTGEMAVFCVRYVSALSTENLSVTIVIRDLHRDNEVILSLDSYRDAHVIKVSPGEGEVCLKLPVLSLKPGAYAMLVELSERHVLTYDRVEAFRFIVKATHDMHDCNFYQPRIWN